MVNPRITDYIQRHRATYTKDALRQMLLQQGYDPAEVEQGFVAVESGQVRPARLTARFWLIFVGYIVALYGITLLLFGITPAGLFIVPILAIPLVIAAGISVLVAALSRGAAMGTTGGIVMVFVLPFIFWVIIAGGCFAMTSPFLFTPQTPLPRSGFIQVQSEPAVIAFGGRATCSFSESGQVVSVFHDEFGGESTAGVDAGSSAGFNVSRTALVTIIQGGVTYQSQPGTRMVIQELSPRGMTGTISYQDLPRIRDGRGEPGAPITISGRVIWECD